jgi:hypothetical protein
MNTMKKYVLALFFALLYIGSKAQNNANSSSTILIDEIVQESDIDQIQSEEVVEQSNSTSSIIGITIEIGITVSPVPVNTTGSITITLNKTANLSINLYNTSGSLVKSIAAQKTYASGKTTLIFNMSDVANGTYALAVEGKGVKKTVKISVYHY